MSDDEILAGAAADIFPDHEAGKVVTRFLHPGTGEVVMELHLDAATARDYAFSLTRASYALEDTP